MDEVIVTTSKEFEELLAKDFTLPPHDFYDSDLFDLVDDFFIPGAQKLMENADSVLISKTSRLMNVSNACITKYFRGRHTCEERIAKVEERKDRAEKAILELSQVRSALHNAVTVNSDIIIDRANAEIAMDTFETAEGPKPIYPAWIMNVLHLQVSMYDLSERFSRGFDKLDMHIKELEERIKGEELKLDTCIDYVMPSWILPGDMPEEEDGNREPDEELLDQSFQ